VATAARHGFLPKSNTRLSSCHSRRRGRSEFGVLRRSGEGLWGASRAFANSAWVSFRVLLNRSFRISRNNKLLLLKKLKKWRGELVVESATAFCRRSISFYFTSFPCFWLGKASARLRAGGVAR
jgi:hypothetical protein